MAAGLRPDPVGELKRSPTPLAAKRGPTSKGGKGRGREGRREREGRRDGKRGGRRVGEGGDRGEGGGRGGRGRGSERGGREGTPQEKFDKSSTGGEVNRRCEKAANFI